jgi:hypothetical protein
MVSIRTRSLPLGRLVVVILSLKLVNGRLARPRLSSPASLRHTLPSKLLLSPPRSARSLAVAYKCSPFPLTIGHRKTDILQTTSHDKHTLDDLYIFLTSPTSPSSIDPSDTLLPPPCPLESPCSVRASLPSRVSNYEDRQKDDPVQFYLLLTPRPSPRAPSCHQGLRPPRPQGRLLPLPDFCRGLCQHGRHPRPRRLLGRARRRRPRSG